MAGARGRGRGRASHDDTRSAAADVLVELGEVFGAEPPASLADADPEALAGLARAIRAAQDHQRAELRTAVDRGYDHIPRLLRGPVRRLLGG